MRKRLVRIRLPWPDARTFASIRAATSAVSLPSCPTYQAPCPELAQESGDTLEVLQRKNLQLRADLRTLGWPKLIRFHGGGRTYELPLRTTTAICSASAEESTAAVLPYLAGFFDGDGCVAGRPGGCTLRVTQSYDKADILLLFRSTFGGSITRNSDGKGLRKPSLRWVVCGPSARSASQLLAPYSITKHRQLLLASEWPQEKSSRGSCMVELSLLKRVDSAIARRCSVGYVSGFFDAEGYIQHRGKATLRLQIGQKFGTVLHCVRRCLAHDLGLQAPVRSYSYPPRSISFLCVEGTSNSKAALRAMLGAGMRCKAAQAELALRLRPENAEQVGAALAELVGNQAYGKRQDQAARTRAFKIASMQAAAGQLNTWQLEKLQALRSEHALLKAQSENVLLQKYVHKIQALQGEIWAVR